MRMFWTMFFLGSMLFVGLDVRERRQSPAAAPTWAAAENDPTGIPTPRPEDTP